jgi:hypothetical protein
MLSETVRSGIKSENAAGAPPAEKEYNKAKPKEKKQ